MSKKGSPRKPGEDHSWQHCAWCGKDLSQDKSSLQALLNFIPGLPELEGYFKLDLSCPRKTLPGFAFPRGSQKRRDGLKYGFLVCSRGCGDIIKQALEMNDAARKYPPDRGPGPL